MGTNIILIQFVVQSVSSQFHVPPLLLLFLLLFFFLPFAKSPCCLVLSSTESQLCLTSTLSLPPSFTSLCFFFFSFPYSKLVLESVLVCPVPEWSVLLCLACFWFGLVDDSLADFRCPGFVILLNISWISSSSLAAPTSSWSASYIMIKWTSKHIHSAGLNPHQYSLCTDHLRARSVRGHRQKNKKNSVKFG